MPLVLFIEWNVFLQKINSPIYCVLLASFTVTLTKENQNATQGSLKDRGEPRVEEEGLRKTLKNKKSNWNGAIKKRSVSIWTAKERSV